MTPHTGELLADNAAHRWPVDTVDLAYTPDGTRLVLSDVNGDLSLLDAETLAPIGEPVHVGAGCGTPKPAPAITPVSSRSARTRPI